MKPGLAALPLEIWADVFDSPWFGRSPMMRRRWLAENVVKFKNKKFAEKLQKILHECGKQTLRYLDFQEKRKMRGSNSSAELLVACHGFRGDCRDMQSSLEKYEFPETDMPENIRGFQRLLIKYLDDQVLDFLTKIKPLFTNVFLISFNIGSIQSTETVPITLHYLLPMLASIRGISCDNACMEMLERKFPGTLTMAKELELFGTEPLLFNIAETASFPACLDWLKAPQDFDLNGPRFLTMHAEPKIIADFVDAVRKQFMAATTSSTFVIFLGVRGGSHRVLDEFQCENATTNEELAVRNAIFNKPKRNYSINIEYMEILRHPTGEDAKLREWMKERAYYETKFKDYDGLDEGLNKVIWICQPTIGRITKKRDAKAGKPGNGKLANVRDEDAAGPSASIKKVEKDIKKIKAMDEDDWNGGDADEAGPSTSAKKMRK